MSELMIKNVVIPIKISVNELGDMVAERETLQLIFHKILNDNGAAVALPQSTAINLTLDDYPDIKASVESIVEQIVPVAYQLLAAQESPVNGVF